MQQTSILTMAATLAVLAGTLTMNPAKALAADGPSDPQIVQIVLSADQIDIDYGNIALAKSKNKAVREFAQRMVTDHSRCRRASLSWQQNWACKGKIARQAATQEWRRCYHRQAELTQR